MAVAADVARARAGEEDRAEVRAVATLAAETFAAMGWEWATVGGVPSVAQVEEVLWDLLATVRKYGAGSAAGTGRLRATTNEDGDVELSLDLGQIEEWCS